MGVQFTPARSRAMSESPHVREVTDDSFEREVLETSRDVPVVVDFWAPWCGPCKTLGPILEELAEEADGEWILAKLNVDENQEAARSFNVRGIPAVKAFVDGEVVDEFTGAKPRSGVERWLEGFTPSEADRNVERGFEQLDSGDLENAEKRFRETLESERYHTRALVGLARVALERGEPDEAADHLDDIPEGMEEEADGAFERTWIAVEAARADNPDALRDRVDADENDLDARFELAMHFADDGELESALEQLLEIVRRDREYRDELGRRSMIRLFQLIGPETDEVREWRKKMGRAMY